MFNAALGTLITLGLVAQVIIAVGVLTILARRNNKAITAEVMKANKRLQDQLASRVG